MRPKGTELKDDFGCEGVWNEKGVDVGVEVFDWVDGG